ncbi:MAG: tryptophan 7-halogenase [Pseudomonadota bacterium]|nr:tryptophan 7-halogenase [Pseudomonadota bacterium]
MTKTTSKETLPVDSCDVLVIGGGPGGSTAAALLAEAGWKVALMEKVKHPRFHIGESLLPMNMPILERLGVMDQLKEIGLVKAGADFTCEAEAPGYHTYLFSQTFDRRYPTAFEVPRAKFDEMLLRNSAARGVDVREEATVTEVDFLPPGGARVTVVDAAGAQRVWSCRFVVDASGRDTFMGRKFGVKRKNPRHASAAIFGHFKNGQRRPGSNAGNISIYQFQHGWMWMIPLRDNIMSVGCVCWPEYLKQRQCSPTEFLRQTIALVPAAAKRLESAELISEVRVTGNYSYTSSSMYGKGYVMVGDSFAFVDPIFSSGVYLAMNSASLAAHAVDVSLRDPAKGALEMRRFERKVRRGLGVFSWFIYRFTTPAMRRMFAGPRNIWRLEDGVTSLLAGDVFGNPAVTLRLRIFKLIYGMQTLSMARAGYAWWRRRRRNTKLRFVGGTTAQDENA